MRVAKLHKPAQRGAGRLGRAINATRKDAAKSPPAPRDKTATATKTTPVGAKAARSMAKAAAPPQRPTNSGSKRSGPSSPAAKGAKKKAATGLSPNPARQKRAKSAAKRSRTKQAGLDSRRLGHVSARGKRAQARRDSKK